MIALVVRDARKSDISAIRGIENASPTAAHWSESHYGEALSAPERLILVAEQDQSGVVGFLVASIAIREWELENIAVSPAARRRGIGRALMTALIDRARRTGSTEIRQEVRASNLAAQNLGLSVGFVQQGRRSNYYRDPVEDALLLKHLLGHDQ
jgi:[ribosomal protein S18]-alanine N-acetyltransferase